MRATYGANSQTGFFLSTPIRSLLSTLPAKTALRPTKAYWLMQNLQPIEDKENARSLTHQNGTDIRSFCSREADTEPGEPIQKGEHAAKNTH